MAVRSEHLTPVRREAPTARKKGQTIKKLRRMIAAGQDYYDYNLLAVVILLTSFGLIMLYSATAYKSMINSETQSTMSYFGKQTLISIVALGIGFFVSRLDYHYLARFAAPLYEASLVLLFLTRFIGREVNGAKRWIYIGPISFQPAEMAKLAVILFIPAPDMVNSFPGIYSQKMLILCSHQSGNYLQQPHPYKCLHSASHRTEHEHAQKLSPHPPGVCFFKIQCPRCSVILCRTFLPWLPFPS